MLASAARWVSLASTLRVGTGSSVSATHETNPAFAWAEARSASRHCAMHCWILIRLRDLIPSLILLPTTPGQQGLESMLAYITLASLSGLWVTSPLTATCLIFPPGLFHLLSAASMTERESGSIVTQLVTRSTRLAQMDKASR